MNASWKPYASIAVLRQRAELLQNIRNFFYARNFLEVETPVLSHASVTDTYLASFATQYQQRSLYLQTSPEYHMKRLLAADSGPIFQLCKAFRDDEEGRLHNPEFTMLEWYRPGFDQQALMDEMQQFLQAILPCDTVERCSYQQLFTKYCNLNPHTATTAQLRHYATIHQLNPPDLGNDTDAWLQLLMLHCIEPHLGCDRPLIVYDFPASQAALAVIRNAASPVAERFEVYYHGIELANGFHELTNPVEQLQRLQSDLAKRQHLKLPIVPIDQHLIAALEAGLPACAGVAVGIDRLVMLALHKQRISEVMSFIIDNA